MNLLFVCNQGRHRSRTAAELYSKQYSTAYAGVYSKTRKLEKKLLEWADAVFVMENQHVNFIAENFPKEYGSKPVINLDIPDVYDYNSYGLVKVLKEKIEPFLEELIKL